jgi:cytidine deaminase
MNHTEDEDRLLKFGRDEINRVCSIRREKNLNDTLFAFVMSESDEIYSGKPFVSNHGQFDHCAERHAINQMQYEETERATIRSVLIAGPVPEGSDQVTLPCGACRHAINEFGSSETTIIASNFVRKEDGWKIYKQKEKYSPSELYPEAYEPVEWK